MTGTSQTSCLRVPSEPQKLHEIGVCLYTRDQKKDPDFGKPQKDLKVEPYLGNFLLKSDSSEGCGACLFARQVC